MHPHVFLHLRGFFSFVLLPLFVLASSDAVSPSWAQASSEDMPATPSVRTTDADAPVGFRVGVVAAYDLPGRARWEGEDLREYLQNPFPLGAGAMAELRAGRTRLSYTYFSSTNLQEALPNLKLSGPLRGTLESGTTMDMGAATLEADSRVDLDARWALRGSGYRWRLGRRMARVEGSDLAWELHTHADVFGFDMRVDFDGDMRGEAVLSTDVGGIPLSWTSKAESASMQASVDLRARGVTLGFVPKLVLEPGSAFRLELGPRLELKTMGVEYRLQVDGDELELPDVVDLGRTHRSSKIGYHLRLDVGPFWMEGNDDSGFADEWSAGLRIDLPRRPSAVERDAHDEGR